MARFRNVLVHLYDKIDPQAVQENLDDIRAYARALYAHLDADGES